MLCGLLIIFLHPAVSQVFQGPGFLGSRFFMVQVFQGLGFSGSGSRVRAQVLEVAGQYLYCNYLFLRLGRHTF